MNGHFIVGIDLGTTNCALAVRDASAPEDQVRTEVLGIPQLVNPGEVGARPLLPSFLYVPGALDFPAGSTSLPWDAAPRFVIGELARKRGAENAARLVGSAKSWLSYGGARRTSPILPWGAPAEVERVSPVDASAAYLRHLQSAFDASRDGHALTDQDILVTVPASFDEEARELTLLAAQAAGLERVTLLEEPQAAFYAWLDAQRDGWRRRVNVGDLVLVCDIGGGTTDFTLIAVSDAAGNLALERVAVGDHILLGGDNMDLALARELQQRLEARGTRLDTLQLHALWHQCRIAKEALLGDLTLRDYPVTLLGTGSRLIGGTVSIPLSRDDVNQALLEGFFPVVPRDRMPARQRRVGLQELGLPYAADPAVTSHLARFLSQQASSSGVGASVRRGRSGLACPTHVLFNGGVMKSAALQERLVAGTELVARCRRVPAGHRARCARSGSRRCARGGVLRHGSPRQRHSDPQRGVAQLLHRHRERDARRAGHIGAAQGVMRGAIRHGRRHVGHDRRSRVRPDHWRTGGVPVPDLHHAQSRPARRADRGLGRRHRGARPARSHLAAPARRRRCDSGDAREPRHGGRHARIVVRRAGSEPPVEAGAEHPRTDRLTSAPITRRLVGVDLGTTNSAVVWVDATEPPPGAVPQLFAVPQLVAAHEVGARPGLPSFVYLPTSQEQEGGVVALPWAAAPEFVVGVFARDHGALVPTRLVSSAKSWLSNRSVDRRAALLPWTSEALRISPVDAAARVLMHLRDAWNHVEAAGDPGLRLEEQFIMLTVPASFDEEARELTVEAARAAGLTHLTLLEEPIAAVYAWMSAHPRELPRALGDGQLLLVCDVGGGTTDFSLIRANDRCWRRSVRARRDR